LGQLHVKQGNLKTAEGLFHEALKYEPDNAWAYVYLGNLYVQQHQFEHAATSYQSAILHQPDYTPTYYLMAAVLEKLGRWSESAALGTQYLEKAPNGVYAPQAKQLLAYVHTQSHVAMMPDTTTPSSADHASKKPSAPQGDGVARGYVQTP
jgi:tetratricopeptide (TPR) repeat protein